MLSSLFCGVGLRARLVVGTLALALAQMGTAPVVHAESFTIAALDGYGIGDCLNVGNSCGAVVADAWCEAHGMAHSTGFGRAEDVTASIRETVASAPAPGSYVVTCAP